MSCPNVQVTSYADFPRCTLTGEVCPYMYRCTTQFTWIPLASMHSCKIKEQDNVNIPEGAYKVRFQKNGFLYVEYKNGVVTIPYDKSAPDYVFLEEIDGVIKIKE